MLTSRISSFSDLFAMLWDAWRGLFHTAPYWDPYGATLGLALLLGLVGYTVKQVMD